MCGRFALFSPSSVVTRQFSLDEEPELVPRYNIAPSQAIAIIRRTAQRTRELAMARWGLIPAWSMEPGTEYSTINARAETVAVKPAFRRAFRSRRCLIPADAYYEWQAVPGTRLKQPFLIGFADRGLFAFAGLWERWEAQDVAVESCTIIVTNANTLTRVIHDRMPVIVDPADYDAWLDPTATQASLQSLLKPHQSGPMSAYPVSTRVNNPRQDDSRLIEPMVSASQPQPDESPKTATVVPEE